MTRLFMFLLVILAVICCALFYHQPRRDFLTPNDYLTSNDYFKLAYRIIQLAKAEQITALDLQIQRACRWLGVDVSSVYEENGGSASTNVEARIRSTVVFRMSRPLTQDEYRSIIDALGHPFEPVLPNDMFPGGATPVWRAKLDFMPYDSTSAITRGMIEASLEFSCVDSRHVHPQ